MFGFEGQQLHGLIPSDLLSPHHKKTLLKFHKNWVAVKELSSSYYVGKPFFTIYIYICTPIILNSNPEKRENYFWNVRP